MYSQNIRFTVPSSVQTGSEPNAKKKRWYRRWWGRLIIGFIGFLLIILIAMGFYVGRVANLLRTGQVTPEQLFGRDISPAQLRTLPTLATSDDPSFGPKDAAVVIVEFSDFQCPFCRQAVPVVKEILKDYGDRVLFVYRDFPLESIHPQAVLAALAGECAHEQGGFWPMHDKIFENQEEISEANLKTYAVQIGLNSIQFGTCLQSAKYLAEVEQDLQDGIEAGVRATPTFFINGLKVEGAIPFNTFEQIILSELSR